MKFKVGDIVKFNGNKGKVYSIENDIKQLYVIFDNCTDYFEYDGSYIHGDSKLEHVEPAKMKVKRYLNIFIDEYGFYNCDKNYHLTKDDALFWKYDMNNYITTIEFEVDEE